LEMEEVDPALKDEGAAGSSKGKSMTAAMVCVVMVSGSGGW
jgi:hypothetical protein